MLAPSLAILAATFTFTFAPPTARPVTQTVHASVVTSVGGVETTRETTEKTVLRFKKVDGGYVLSGTATEIAVKVNGRDATDQFSKMLEGLDVTCEISDRGELKAIRGYDGVIRKVKESMPKDGVPPETEALLAKVFSEEALVARAKAEWDGRIGGFAGQTVEIGDIFEAESAFPLPTGESVSTTTIAGKEKCGSAECLRILFEYNTDPNAMKKTLDAIAGALPQDARVVQEGMTITGSGERLIDPATMNIHRETNERTMRMPVTGPNGEKVLTVRTEKKKYTFEY